MKRITITITEEEHERLTEIAHDHETTAAQMLAAFVADLTCSKNRGGSDESMMADDWLARQTCRW